MERQLFGNSVELGQHSCKLTPKQISGLYLWRDENGIIRIDGIASSSLLFKYLSKGGFDNVDVFSPWAKEPCRHCSMSAFGCFGLRKERRQDRIHFTVVFADLFGKSLKIYKECPNSENTSLLNITSSSDFNRQIAANVGQPRLFAGH